MNNVVTKIVEAKSVAESLFVGGNVVLCVGEYEFDQTYLKMAVAHAISTGEDCFGLGLVEGDGAVVYINHSISKELMKDRFVSFCSQLSKLDEQQEKLSICNAKRARGDRIKVVDAIQQSGEIILNTIDTERLKGLIGSACNRINQDKPSLIIFDSIHIFHDLDPEDFDDMIVVLSAFKTIAQTYDATVLINVYADYGFYPQGHADHPVISCADGLVSLTSSTMSKCQCGFEYKHLIVFNNHTCFGDVREVRSLFIDSNDRRYTVISPKRCKCKRVEFSSWEDWMIKYPRAIVEKHASTLVKVGYRGNC
ncbi:AAA family ATPase [Vibrio vulnificus]|nr:AAA family ATPase [Vibrio vulnificus]